VYASAGGEKGKLEPKLDWTKKGDRGRLKTMLKALMKSGLLYNSLYTCL